MKDIIDGIKYLNGEIKDLDGKIEKGEDLRQELKARRALNHIETRRYNPKFHKDIVENQERELDEIDLQILINEGQLLTHQKERGEHTWHLKELKQRWRKQSTQDTPANIPQDKPQTPGGVTGNPTGQATPEARNTASKPQTPAGATVNEPQAIATFPLPSGTTVGDIEMKFLDELTVRIQIMKQSEVFNFAQLGFLDSKTGKPNKLWTALAVYAGGNGITNQKDSERINKTLQAFFRTKQKLLTRIETFFKISMQTATAFRPSPIATSEKKTTSQSKMRPCPTCQDRHTYFCKICKEDSEHCQECHDCLEKHNVGLA